MILFALICIACFTILLFLKFQALSFEFLLWSYLYFTKFPHSATTYIRTPPISCGILIDCYHLLVILICIFIFLKICKLFRMEPCSKLWLLCISCLIRVRLFLLSFKIYLSVIQPHLFSGINASVVFCKIYLSIIQSQILFQIYKSLFKVFILFRYYISNICWNFSQSILNCFYLDWLPSTDTVNFWDLSCLKITLLYFHIWLLI